MYSPVKGAADISLAPAIRIFHRRYSVPLVATLFVQRSATYSELLGRIGAARDTLSETLSYLLEVGVVTRTPAGGIQPPARPEYALTPLGERLGPPCLDLVREIPARGLLAIALKKWPMLVAIALGRGSTRFGELRTALPGITPRSLSAALRDLEAAGLATRTVAETYPPQTLYRLTAAGQDVLPWLDALAVACEVTSHESEPRP